MWDSLTFKKFILLFKTKDRNDKGRYLYGNRLLNE